MHGRLYIYFFLRDAWASIYICISHKYIAFGIVTT